MSWSGTVTCSHCYRQGHNKRKCEKLTEEIEDQYHGAAAMAEKERAAGNDVTSSAPRLIWLPVRR